MVRQAVCASRTCEVCAAVFDRRRWPDGTLEESAYNFKHRRTCSPRCHALLIWRNRPRPVELPCKVCDRAAVAKGLCANHRRQQKRREKKDANSKGSIEKATG